MTVNDLTNFSDFKLTLGYSEGGGNYKAVYKNSAGVPLAFGKYQFIDSRLTDVANFLGVSKPDYDEFLNNKDEQENSFIGHCNLMLRDLQNNGSMDYIGTPIKGANKYPIDTVTNVYGLLGGGHLAGVNGVKNYFENGTDASDSLGTHTSDYIAKFSNKVSFVEKTLKAINETVKTAVDAVVPDVISNNNFFLTSLIITIMTFGIILLNKKYKFIRKI